MVATGLAACGARTGLRVHDAGDVADAADVVTPSDHPIKNMPPDVPPPPPDVPPPDVCAPVTLSLLAGTAEVLFVIDRSTSMTWPLGGLMSSGTSRWMILNSALTSVLPRYDTAMDMGLVLFPAGSGSSTEPLCNTVVPLRQTPTRRGASALLGVLASTTPSGRTPTAAALQVTQRYFSEHPMPGRVRAAVLATDGAPNCNAALDGTRCVCTSGTSTPGQPSACATTPELCLDDAQTVAAVEALARDGVPTYIIGLDGDPDPALRATLTRLAMAGLRPNPIDPMRGYYSVTRAEDVTAAFDRIQRSIVRCSFSLATPLPMNRPVTLRVDGAVLAQRADHADGWDWTDSTQRGVEVYGPACMRLQDGAHRVEFLAECP